MYFQTVKSNINLRKKLCGLQNLDVRLEINSVGTNIQMDVLRIQDNQKTVDMFQCLLATS